MNFVLVSFSIFFLYSASLIFRFLATVTFVCITFVGCAETKNSGETQKTESPIPKVLTVNYPLQYFAERIAGDLNGEKLTIEFPFDEDIDPVNWKPSSVGIKKFQTADLILLNGAGYSKWLSIVSLLDEKVVNTSSGFQDSYIKIDESFVHQHGPEGERSASQTAIFTWLDFQQAKQQAVSVRNSLARLLPDEEKHFDANFAILSNDLVLLDEQMSEAIKKLGKQTVYSTRPIYQYLSRRYGLEIRPMNWTTETAINGYKIGDAELADLEKQLAENPAKLIVWDVEPSQEHRKILTEKFDLQCVIVDPCSNVGNHDWLKTMNQNVVNILTAND